MNKFLKPLFFAAVLCLGLALSGISIFAENVTEEHVHTEQILPEIPPSCSAHGMSEGVICSECHEVLVAQKPIPALPHNTDITIPGVPPSCGQYGLTDGKKCSVCNVVSLEQKRIPKTVHTLESVPAVIANCTSKGYSEGVICSVCTEIIVAQAEVPINPEVHLYDGVDDAVCNGCGYTRTFSEQSSNTPEDEHSHESGGCQSVFGASLSVIASTTLALWLAARKKSHI